MIRDIYCDAGVIGGNPSIIGGAWAWCFVGDEDRVLRTGSGLVLCTRYHETPQCESFCTTSDMQRVTSNYMEMWAAKQAIEATPRGWRGILYTDSEVTFHRLTGNRPWLNMPIAMKSEIMAALSIRSINIGLVKGHPHKNDLMKGSGRGNRYVSRHNVWCDSECKRLAKLYRDSIE